MRIPAALLSFAAYLSAALLLWAPTLHSFFIFDDISTLAMATPLGRVTLGQCWEPIALGFWRPLPLSLAWIVVRLFGPAPLPTHLLPIFFHALNGTLCFIIGKQLGWSGRRSFAAGMLLILHFGAFVPVCSFQTLMDVMVTTGILGGILAAISPCAGTMRLALVAACYLFAIGCKETAVVYPVVVYAWFAVRGRYEPRGLLLRVWVAAVIVTVLHGGAVLCLQRLYGSSYMQSGRVHFAPVSFVRQMLDYLFSLALPQVHAVAMPWFTPVLSHPVLWAIRFSLAIGLVLLGIASLRAKDFFTVALVASAAACLAPPSLLGGAPEARFLYAGIPFFAFLLCHLAGSQNRSVAFGVKAFAVSATLLSLISFRASPTVLRYVESAKTVEDFVQQVSAASADWPDGSMIAIYDHPHPMAEESYRWALCQELFNLFLPEKPITLALDKTPPEAFAAYRFKDGALIRIR
ncbi:hypothetical protein BH09SUM1_BH09SUM1_27120 [soil metagenome]